MAEEGNQDQEKLACHICRAEIPKAVALHAEGREYIHHFCSAGCLVEWEKKQDSGETRKE